MINRHIAVIGAGYWGKNLVRNFEQLGVLKTVCDGSDLVRKQLVADYPGITVSGDINEVLADKDIKGVVVATPAIRHLELTEKVLLADKHAFVEKPLSLTYGDGEKLVQLAAARKKVLFVGHILHYHPAIIRLKQMLNAGEIGRIQYIYSRRLSLGKIRREENILWSFAPHDISIILSLTGEEPSYIDSIGSNYLHARIPDVTMTSLKFPSGIGAHIFVSWLNPFKEQRLVIVGDRGMAVFDDTQPIAQKLTLYPHTINWKNGIPVPHQAESICIDLQPLWQEPLKAECEAYLQAIRTGEPPITSGEEGLRVLKVLEISQRSIEAKEKLPLMPPSHASPADDALAYYVNPTAIIDDNVAIGKGTKIWHFSHVLHNSRIGSNCNIGQNVMIGPDVMIGNNCKIQNNVSVFKGVTLEDGVFCGPSMVFTNIVNPRAEIPKMDQLRPTLVKKGASIGANATVICGHTIGRYAFIGAGAVVTKDVPDHALMLGNPARQVGWVCECGEQLKDGQCCRACSKDFSF